MFVPGSDRIANAALIAASVVAIAILAQMHVGPIWLQPLAVLRDRRRAGKSTRRAGRGDLRRPRDSWTSGIRPRRQCLDEREPLRTIRALWPWLSGGADRGGVRRRLAERAAGLGPGSRERRAPGARRDRALLSSRRPLARDCGTVHAGAARAGRRPAVDLDARDHGGGPHVSVCRVPGLRPSRCIDDHPRPRAWPCPLRRRRRKPPTPARRSERARRRHRTDP